MNIVNEYPVMIFRNEFNGKTYYKAGLSKLDAHGEYLSGYIPIRFKKEVELENQTKIYIKKAWLDFYLKNKQTIPYIMCTEFELLKDAMNNGKKETTENVSDVEPVIELEELNKPYLDDAELPF